MAIPVTEDERRRRTDRVKHSAVLLVGAANAVAIIIVALNAVGKIDGGRMMDDGTATGMVIATSIASGLAILYVLDVFRRLATKTYPDGKKRTLMAYTLTFSAVVAALIIIFACWMVGITG